MRKTLLIVAAISALAASPAISQGRSGGAGGGPGGGAGAGPPISPPGVSGGHGASDAARDIASQRGAFGREFGAQQHLTAEERRLQAVQYQALAAQRKADALAYAQAARSGRPLPANSARDIRAALKADIEAWRQAFQVSRKEWQDMRDQWLVDRASLSPQEWALRRAAWFDARDTWIATQKDWALARRR